MIPDPPDRFFIPLLSYPSRVAQYRIKQAKYSRLICGFPRLRPPAGLPLRPSDRAQAPPETGYSPARSGSASGCSSETQIRPRCAGRRSAPRPTDGKNPFRRWSIPFRPFCIHSVCLRQPFVNISGLRPYARLPVMRSCRQPRCISTPAARAAVPRNRPGSPAPGRTGPTP